MCTRKHLTAENSYEPIYEILYYGNLDFLDTCDEEVEYEEESTDLMPELYLPGIEDDTIH